MKALSLAAVSAVALTTAACGNGPPPMRAALDCPQSQGDLTRTSAAPDGKTCIYASPGGAEVTLQLVSTQGGVENALTAVETNLMAERAKAEETAAAAAEAGANAAEAGATKPAAEAKAASSAAEQAQREANADTANVDVKIEVGKKGAIVTESRTGDVTRVELPGIHIVANDRDETAKVQVGPIKIDAGGDAATVRIGPRDVRLRGEQLSREKRGVKATFIYASDELRDGYRYVGYEAGGPKRGPITVAVVKSKTEEPDEGDLHRDVKRLVRKNGGI